MKIIRISIIFMLVCLIMYGCNTKSDEKRIERAMNDYVKANFANPKDYKGILSITSIDTMDVTAIALKMIDDKEFDSIYNARIEYTKEIIDTAMQLLGQYHRFSNDELSELVDCHYGILFVNKSNTDSVYCTKIDSLLNIYQFEPMRRYEVKVKTIQNGALEYVEKDYEAQVTKSNVGISNRTNDFACYSKNKEELILLLNYISKLATQRTENLKTTRNCVNLAKNIEKQL